MISVFGLFQTVYLVSVPAILCLELNFESYLVEYELHHEKTCFLHMRSTDQLHGIRTADQCL